MQKRRYIDLFEKGSVFALPFLIVMQIISLFIQIVGSEMVTIYEGAAISLPLSTQILINYIELLNSPFNLLLILLFIGLTAFSIWGFVRYYKSSTKSQNLILTSFIVNIILGFFLMILLAIIFYLPIQALGDALR